MLPGHDEHLVGHGAPERADHDDPVVGVDHPLGRVLLRLDGRAQEARADEAGEAGLLLGELAGDEGHAEQLPVRVLERGSRLAAGVHDGLGVAEVGLRGVLLEAVAQRRHDQLDLLLAELPQGGVVLGGEDEDLVDAAGGGLGEDRAPVGHDEGLVALEGRVEVGHDPDEPAAGRAVGLEGGRRVLLVAGAERAGAIEGLGHPGGAGHERVGPLGAAGAHDHPAARQRIEAQLVHRSTLSGASRPADIANNLIVFPPPLRYRFRCPRKRHRRGTSPGPHGHRRTCRPCITSRTDAAFDIVLLLHVGCVVVGLVTTATAAATAARLRRLLRVAAAAARAPAALLPARGQLGRAHRLRHPGLRVRPPRHEPGGLRARARAGCWAGWPSSPPSPWWARGCCGRPSGGCRSALAADDADSPRGVPGPRRHVHGAGGRGGAGAAGGRDRAHGGPALSANAERASRDRRVTRRAAPSLRRPGTRQPERAHMPGQPLPPPTGGGSLPPPPVPPPPDDPPPPPLPPPPLPPQLAILTVLDVLADW